MDDLSDGADRTLISDEATPTSGRRPRSAIALLAAIILLGSLLYLLVRAFGSATSLHQARPWLAVAVLVAIAGIVALLLSERERAAAARAATQARALAEQAGVAAERARAAEHDARDREEIARASESEARAAESAARVAQREADAGREAAQAAARDAQAGRESSEAAERDARAAEQSAREQLEDAEAQRDRLRTEAVTERTKREQVVRAWRGERDWNRDLRTQIERMQRAQGMLGRHDDVRRMVLELTMKMVDAEKGLLLSHRADGNGHEVVCFAGWDSDPRDSALAQRFADEVIERDTTVRQDDESQVDAERRTAADEEVRNLLAIPIYLSDSFAGVIVCANRDGGFAELDDEVLLAVGDHAGAVLQNSRLHGDLRSAYLSTIGVLANAIELKDPELRGHSDHVSEYVLAVADRLQFDPERREKLIFASLLHDVGKLGISERILLKPARLTDEERTTIQLHPRIGYQLVAQVPALQDIAPAVLHHHERFDGEGYPGGLRGETIPLESRIIAVADSFSAITTDRPYSAARSPEEACQELERCAGGQFDPEVVRLFVEEVRRRPPVETDAAATPVDPELDVHRVEGEYRLGARSFGITDSLTLLYSHRHFHETASAQALRAQLQDRPFAVIVAELVGIEEVNLARGFGAGDEVLQAVGEVFQRVAARYRGLAFRASGRRIALLGPDLDQSTVGGVVAALRIELSQSLNGDHVTVAPVLGAAVWRAGQDGEQVIGDALDAAHAAAMTLSPAQREPAHRT